MSGGSVFTIAPHADFLATLADRLLDGTIGPRRDPANPFWLADCTVILPTRRARLALGEVLMGRGEMLLPDIRTFGSEDGDEDAFLPPYEDTPAPAPVSSVERQLVLSRLVAAWAATDDGRRAFAFPPSAGEIFAMSASLGEIIDEFTISRIDPGALDGLVEGDVADNWRQTLRFLAIAFEFWPNHLAARHRADRTALQNRRLERLASALPLVFGNRTVIAAGSTGSVPASADLMVAISRLTSGTIVLPGLDTTLEPDAMAALRNRTGTEQGHPQYGLVHLIDRLGVAPESVTELASSPDARTGLVRLALATTRETAQWRQRQPDASTLAAALGDLAVIAARTDDEQARAIAVIARERLGRGKSVGIVSPDRTLGRRIAAELCRFGIVVDDPAGQPLYHSPAGRLVRQMLTLMEGGCAAPDIVALLRNDGLSPTADLETRRALIEALDFGLLRGRRHDPGLSGLRQSLARAASPAPGMRAAALTPDETDGIASLLDWLEAGLAPLAGLLARKVLHAHELANAIMAAFGTLVAGQVEGADELRLWAEAVMRPGAEGFAFRPERLCDTLAALMAGHEVRRRTQARRDIAIWGRLEARLQSPDVMILAALNEDRWPEPADPGPWLSRKMKIEVGLEAPERRQSLAAHDFTMALGTPDCILAWSQRVDTGPALPSRYVQRLRALVGEEQWKSLEQAGSACLSHARRLDDPGRPQPERTPAPNPPAEVRPRRLSVTQVETLIHSPYDIYARHVLRLRPVDRLGADPTLAERGTLVHEIFARFFAQDGNVAAPDAAAQMRSIAAEAFSRLDAIAERRDIWMRRIDVAIEALLDFERQRNDRVERRFVEVAGERVYPVGRGFTLTGRADRVDLMTDKSLEILDFKTGAVPGAAETRAFLAPQLLLEGAIARAGQMGGVPKGEISALRYIKVEFGPKGVTASELALDKTDDYPAAIDEIEYRLQRHVDVMLMQDTPMVSHLLPRLKTWPGDYDHLARVREWALAQGEEDVSP